MAGVVPQGITDATADTWSELGQDLANRRGILRFSAAGLQTGGVSFGTYPLDILSHTAMHITAGGTGAVSDTLSEGLAPIVIIFEPVTTAAEYALTFHLEWKFRSRFDPLLISTHRVHAPATESTWAKIMHLGQQTSGLIDAIGGVVTAIKNVPVLGSAVARGGAAVGLA
jgi:hypothetical protein